MPSVGGPWKTTSHTSRPGLHREGRAAQHRARGLREVVLITAAVILVVAAGGVSDPTLLRGDVLAGLCHPHEHLTWPADARNGGHALVPLCAPES
eukprot:scaffold533467_cov35-Prasinocladus_malaysianus.AAC.1